MKERFPKELNLYAKELSDAKYTIHRYPDGEVQIEVFDLVDRIIAPVRNPEELFILLQVLKWSQDTSKEITIPYLMSARNDRKMLDGSTINLELVLTLIGMNLNEYDTLVFITPHNEEAITKILSYVAPDVVLGFKYEVCGEAYCPGTLIIFPDEGALKRFGEFPKFIVAKKERDFQTGKITHYSLDFKGIDTQKIEKIVVIDDLFDGGATFRHVGAAISEFLEGVYQDRPEVILSITHLIQEDRLIAMAESNMFDKIYVSGTYQEVPDYNKIINIDL